MNLFDLDSPFMHTLNKMFDLVILNIIAVVCSLPVVTIGAATTALYTAIDASQKEEGNLLRVYFSSFRANFKQATLLWLILMVLGTVTGYSLLVSLVSEKVDFGMLIAAAVGFCLWMMFTAWTFPLQAKFENKVLRTLRNAVVLSVGYLLRSIVMALLIMLPWLMLAFAPGLFLQIMPVWMLAWFSLAAWINWKLLKKPFRDLTGEEAEDSTEGNEE